VRRDLRDLPGGASDGVVTDTLQNCLNRTVPL